MILYGEKYIIDNRYHKKDSIVLNGFMKAPEIDVLLKINKYIIKEGKNDRRLVLFEGTKLNLLLLCNFDFSPQKKPL